MFQRLLELIGLYVKSNGRIIIIFGSMFSGKSERLIYFCTRFSKSGAKVVAFNHASDTRYDESALASHGGKKGEAVSVADVFTMRRRWLSEFRDRQVFVIDEAQFFGMDLVAFAKELRAAGKIVIIAGLNTDFRGLDFGPVPLLIRIADARIQMSAMCNYPGCYHPAHWTQRVLITGPASYYSQVVLVGADETYEARCHRHHDVPFRPLWVGLKAHLKWRFWMPLRYR